MKGTERKFVGLKEIIIVVLFSVLTFIVSMVTALPFAASVHLQLYAGYALMAVISGPIYVLMISKAPKVGTQVLFFAVKGLYMLIMGQVLTGIIFIVGGFICELIVMNDGYHSVIRSGAAYMLHMTLYGLGSFFPVLFLGDTFRAQLLSRGYDAEAVETMVSLYSSPVIILTVVLCLCVASALGMFIGSRMMKKHFVPGGAV